MLSGFVDNYTEAHKKRIDDEIIQMGGKSVEVDIKCFSVTKLLLENNLTNIDFLSIDVEGSELDILESVDFNKIKIDIILAENNYQDSKLSLFLKTKGYELVQQIAIDEVYKLKKL